MLVDVSRHVLSKELKTSNQIEQMITEGCMYVLLLPEGCMHLLDLLLARAMHRRVALVSWFACKDCKENHRVTYLLDETPMSCFTRRTSNFLLR